MRPTCCPKPLLCAGVLMLSATCGCALIDQRTFAPDPEPPTTAQVASVAAPDRRLPLLTIRYDVQDPSYEEPLRTAIQAARQRNAEIEFDVVAVAPGLGGAPNASSAALSARNDAVEVMRTMMRLGVSARNIRLGARTDGSTTVREVRIFVR